MEWSFNTRIKRTKKFKEFASELTIPLSNVHKDYPHLTFHINNFFDFLQIVKLMRTVHYEDETLVFRGMSNSEWSAIPSLGRIDSYDETIEYRMISEFMALRPEAFQGLQSNFEILAKMQHYGLPTRLLDFTTNPLVALYFACISNHQKDARILCSSTYLTDSRDGIVEAICSSYKQRGIVNLRVEDLLANTNKTAYEYIFRLYLQNDFRPLFVKPWYWNQRIINQAAIFLVFPNMLYDFLGKIVYYQDFPEEGQDRVELYEKYCAISENERLDKIYPVLHLCEADRQTENNIERIAKKRGISLEKELLVRRDFSVNCKTMKKLFSFYDHSALLQTRPYQLTQYSEFGRQVLERRFLFEDELEPIDVESMKSMFCSIIIDKKAKKEIISDIESIGIDKAFIFPELEYTAEKIKNRFV